MQLYHIYSLYHLVLCSSLYLCASVVQLYRAYSLYYPVLYISSDLCVAYFCYFAALTQILHSLVAPTQLVSATASCWTLPLKIQWWRSCSGQPPSTLDPPSLPFPHWFHPTYQAFQACPYKPFFNQHAKCCYIYLPLQSISEPTRQANPCETLLSFHNRLPAPPSHFRTDMPIQVLWYSPLIPHQITFPSNPFSDPHAKPSPVSIILASKY